MIFVQPRARRFVGPSVGAFVALLAVAAACDNDADESACKVDTDCPQGNICRDQRCGPVSPEGGAPAADVTAPPTCAAENAICAMPEECCSRICTSGRCATSVQPPVTCKGSLELCQNDCCSGLTCTSGVCR